MSDFPDPPTIPFGHHHRLPNHSLLSHKLLTDSKLLSLSAPPPTDCSGCSAARAACQSGSSFLKSPSNCSHPAPADRRAGRIQPRRAHTETGRPPNQSRQINCRARFLLRSRRSDDGCCTEAAAAVAVGDRLLKSRPAVLLLVTLE